MLVQTAERNHNGKQYTYRAERNNQNQFSSIHFLSLNLTNIVLPLALSVISYYN